MTFQILRKKVVSETSKMFKRKVTETKKLCMRGEWLGEEEILGVESVFQVRVVVLKMENNILTNVIDYKNS